MRGVLTDEGDGGVRWGRMGRSCGGGVITPDTHLRLTSPPPPVPIARASFALLFTYLAQNPDVRACLLPNSQAQLALQVQESAQSDSRGADVPLGGAAGHSCEY